RNLLRSSTELPGTNAGNTFAYSAKNSQKKWTRSKYAAGLLESSSRLMRSFLKPSCSAAAARVEMVVSLRDSEPMEFERVSTSASAKIGLFFMRVSRKRREGVF